MINLIYSSDGEKYWLPKNHHLICSQHFIGGKKSDVIISPSFSPTIFSSKAPKAKDLQDLKRSDFMLNKHS